ncbi:TIGR04283 family arsenosugar biosynthesis glycosyltransferase [soil metagenome]
MNSDLFSQKISVIIPVYNEENTIVRLLNHLRIHGCSYNLEIVVVDGGSEDSTVDKVRNQGINCICSKKGRAFQMNTGVKHSNGEILYFVHADSIPPLTFPADILNAVTEGYEAGCYRFKFDSERPLLKINSYFTRFDRLMSRGGDQTLFITRSLFDKLGGYKEDYVIMEDFDLIERIRRESTFKIIPDDVTVSARKYSNNSYLKVNFVNLVIFIMYFMGASPQTMLQAYKSLIHKTKFG